MELKRESIKLIGINSNTVLFFHTETLQIYPLEKDDTIYKFLYIYEKKGENGAKQQFGTDYDVIYNFISNKIDIAPISTVVPVDNMVQCISVILPISGHCNLACPYCFARTEAGFRFHDFVEQDIIDVLTFVANHNSGKTPINIAFFGGEPLLRLDLIKFTILHAAKTYPDKEFHFSITTNGTILNDEIISIIKEYRIGLLLSVDGPDNEFNLRVFKNGEKSISQVLDNIQKLKEAGIQPELRATLINTNPYIVETYQFFEKLKLPFNIIFAFSSQNKSHHYADYDSSTILEIRKQLGALLEYYNQKLHNKERIYNNLIGDFVNVFRFRAKRNIPCLSGRKLFTITNSGDIFTCQHFENDPNLRIGNIHSGGIIESERTKYIPLPVEQIESCKNCWIKNLCLGGCMSQKIESGYNNLSPLEKGECELQKAIWEFNLKFYYNITQIAPSILQTKKSKISDIEC